MRTPILACALIAVTTTVVLASPVAATGAFNPTSERITAGKTPTTPQARDVLNKHENDGPMRRSRFAKRALDQYTAGGNAISGAAQSVNGGSVDNPALAMDASNLAKRTDDADTMGGNAYTGSTGDASGGGVSNIASDDGMPTIMNVNSNNAGLGGYSLSGCSNGGQSENNGAGGNSYSGSTGNAEGGSVSNVGGMINMDSNDGGAAGYSESGCATGGLGRK